uniref:Pectinesterase n=1 Tax=Kalanchoe fedtschenkoi TaxID=63787 RepID=A0A7N1A1J4_KALFE
MAFQEFSHFSERRKAERQQKLRKRIIIGVVSSIVLVAVIAAAAISVVHYQNKSADTTNAPSKQQGQKQSNQQQPAKESVSASEKAVKTMCASVDYQDRCESSLSSMVKTDPKLATPKELVKAAIQAASKEVSEAFDTMSAFKFETQQEKDAFDDCKELMETAKEELADSVSNAGPSRTHDVNTWLSAVMSYTQTCIDGFPEGKLKTQIEKTYQASKELTSNSLAIVSQVSSALSQLNELGGAKRNLLAYPIWMRTDDRRFLKADKHEEAKLNANVTVAKDGSGNFTTISAALEAMPKKFKGRYVMYVKEGVYDEQVTITKEMANVTMYGDGSQKTTITGNKNFVDGVRTFKTASFVALGEGFMAKAMGFRNTAGPEKHQAVAARVQSDRSIFLNCRFEGYQDTLYVQTHRQFYRSCVITGTVDFIFGDAAAIIQNTLIKVRKPLENQQNIVTAQGRVDKRENTGIVLQNCRIEADESLEGVKGKFKTYLGRPWKDFSRTVVMESTIGDLVHPEGWMPWDGELYLKTLYYAEYSNKGPGADTNARVKWPGYQKSFSREQALKFTVGPFLQGDTWIKPADVPVRFGMYA